MARQFCRQIIDDRRRAVNMLLRPASHRMLGPGVPLRRHIEALKNGDYASRVTLRPGDAFGEIAEDLNELAACLEEAEKRR